MATPGGRSRPSVIPPDKGSFPIDHFKECEQLVQKYIKCVNKHQMMPKRCQDFQIEYLDCRMKNGLMNQETMENLGFTEKNTIDTELAKKKELAEKFIRINDEAKKNVENYYKNLYKN